MLSLKYKQAISEVLAMLDNTEKKYVEMIPSSFMSFLEKNTDKSYKTVYDPSKPFSEAKLNPETAGILSIIYLNYWCSPEEKKEFEKILHENQLKYDEVIRKSYNPNSPFLEKNGDKKIEIKTDTNELLKESFDNKLSKSTKKGWFSSIINKIKSFFNL